MRCPVCRADNTETSCRRCKANLSLLLALEQERERLLAAARLALVSGDGRQALVHAGKAEQLRRGEDASRFLALGHLVGRDFSAAWVTYKNMQIRQKVGPPTIDHA
jgi:hypothetical protein